MWCQNPYKIQLEFTTVWGHDWYSNSFMHVLNSHNLKIVVMLEANVKYNKRTMIIENVQIWGLSERNH